VDDSDSDQILAIEELRSLRDRTGDYAPRPEAVTSAAPIQAPDPSAGIRRAQMTKGVRAKSDVEPDGTDDPADEQSPAHVARAVAPTWGPC